MGGSMDNSGPMWMPMLKPTVGRLAAWHPQPFPLLPILCLLAALAYGYAVLRLRHRGDSWPVNRTIYFALGLLTIVAVTATGVGGYSMTMFSVHMAQHMTLTMLSPILLLMGAPMTLTLRALPVAAKRGSKGPREVLIAVLHSRWVRVITSPFFTLPLFVASLYGLYFTPLFDFFMHTWWRHDLMMMHFVAVGLLFYYPILGVDPGPSRKPVFGILELLGSMPFHAFFGIDIMMSSTLIVHSFAHPPLAWGIGTLGDQRAGGGIAWAFSEIPTVLVMLAVFVRWRHSEERVARRTDRAADRDGDAKLAAYNAYLAGLSRND